MYLISCTESKPVSDKSTYFDNSGRDDVYTGGVKMIPITTPKGTFHVWTKRVGNNPRIKLLLLHGGPGATHELYECFDTYLPAEGIEYYYYDQLGSYYSDQPSDTSLWNLPRFVEEVEQVRQALGLTKDNFYLLGQSWGGLLAMEYARKYQQHLKGLIISNMVSSIPDYMKYADEVLGPQMPPDVFKEIMAMEAKEDYGNPRYMELITEHYYTKHVLRKPLDQWPEPINRCFKHLNPEVYVLMQGPSEFGVKGNAKLKNWEFKQHLPEISVPTLTIGGQFDTMDPEHMKWMASQVKRGKYLHCPNSGHLSQFDDQEIYINGVVEFLKEVDGGGFN
jgi:proline iminopeptidase